MGYIKKLTEMARPGLAGFWRHLSATFKAAVGEIHPPIIGRRSFGNRQRREVEPRLASATDFPPGEMESLRIHPDNNSAL